MSLPDDEEYWIFGYGSLIWKYSSSAVLDLTLPGLHLILTGESLDL